jgi:hypothetical protein
VKVSKKAVTNELGMIAKNAMDRLESDAVWMSEHDFKGYSATFANFRYAIEQAYLKAMEEVNPE